MRARFLRWSLLLLAGAPCTGCLVPPGAVVRTAQGEVRAPDPELAREAARHVERTRAELARRLPGLRDISTDVWVQRKAYAGAMLWFRAGSLHAFTLESSALPHPRIHVPVATYESSITHELVHALLGPDWNTLPAVVEEGLCDLMSVELAGDTQRRLNLLLSATLADELATQVGREAVRPERLLEARESLDLHQDGSDFAAYAYGMGYVLVSRIAERYGLTYLHQLALRAREEGLERIPAGWLLPAAELRATRPIEETIAEELDAAFFDHLARSGELRRMIEGFKREGTVDAGSLDTIVLTYAAEGYPSRGIRRRLVDLPGWARWARENRAFLAAP